MANFFLSLLTLSLLTLSFLTSYANAQQNYSKDSALDCNANDDAGPSSAFLYTCNGQDQSCQAFLIFKSQTCFNSVPSISALTSANQGELARINNVTRLSEFPANNEVIFPVNCFCFDQYYQANTTIQVTTTRGTYHVIANETYEGLSTCAALKRLNIHGEYDLLPGEELQVALRCACPTTNQMIRGTEYLVTYPLSSDDIIPDIADRFKVSTKDILDANGMEENPTLYPDTTILIPLPTQPTSSQTIIHSNPDISPPSALSPRNRGSKKRFYESSGLAAACSLLVISIITAVVFLSCKKTREKVSGRGRERKQVVPEDIRVEIASYEQVLKVFKFEEVRKATENLSSESRINGCVYRREFGGEILAVKKMSRDVTKEVNILKRINHFNLIKLEGFEETGNWAQRIQIALDVANGLYYLHSFTEPAYVHKDIKSSNVLLNGNLRAKIANFSLARAATNADKTWKDAVFTQDGREALLSTEIVSIVENKNPEVELDFFVDPAQKGSCGTNFALCLAKVSVACLMKEPARRPRMEEVPNYGVRHQMKLLGKKKPFQSKSHLHVGFLNSTIVSPPILFSHVQNDGDRSCI
ncbi:lysM domain receptor-like kinase 4 [Populus alba x Populus x berolinensis]|uniref:LysM domain receptor-like kinase 4 n=1 Tax=Populus alba x Populus x berolinensis TaxID=444605 RepID=A0AAD6LR76_9ROSI|nr:lysM domain receptor-like kinase 4 [Populus alba x Populus x berolinensis]